MSTQREDIAAAVTWRMANMRVTAPSQTLYMEFDEEHDLRQAFRRRIDREILEGNRSAVAIESLKVVLRLARNILGDPENPKYRRFRINNERIKRTVMSPKGVLQLVTDAENYDSYYVYTAKTHNSLRIGSSMIEEILEREVKKYEDEERRQEREKAEHEAHEAKLHLQFIDDRKSVNARVQRERHEPRLKGIPARRKGPVKPGNIVTLHDKRQDSEASGPREKDAIEEH
ncbi:hypothetical protein C8Q74DRAFT_822727 [Fomes fomentarius]|nr:hypothetical protein C8Q74DRAFT_822727 [Fomes fomentarius]